MIVTNLQPPAREPAPGSFHYASLALAGLVPDNDATPGAAARPQRRVRRNGNATNAPSMAVTMRSIRRMDTSNAETASHAATVLYRPSELAGMDDDDADDGMPLHEVQAYFGLRNGNQAVDDLVAGAMAALHGNFQRCGVRIDFWFTTREAGVPATHYSIPHARLNGLIREVPRLFQGLRAVAGNVGQLRECCSHALARFKQEIARMHAGVEPRTRSFSFCAGLGGAALCGWGSAGRGNHSHAQGGVRRRGSRGCARGR